MASQPETTPEAPRERWLKRWETFSEAAGQEKKWMHERLNWVLLSQPILFTALGFLLNVQSKCDGTQTGRLATLCAQAGLATHGVSFLGLAISSFALIGLAAAGRMHWKWTSAVNEISKIVNDLDFVRSDSVHHSIVSFGNYPHWPARTSSLVAPTICGCFLFLWIIIDIFNDSVAWSLAIPLTVLAMNAGILLCSGFFVGHSSDLPEGVDLAVNGGRGHWRKVDAYAPEPENA